jgi:serine/threonine protein kinase
MVKVYLYDPMCESLRTSVEANFQNEVLFQIYANRLHGKLDFISPELYSWGQVMRHMLKRDGYKYKCLYLIMEYIPFITLKDVSQISNVTEIYERVDILDKELKIRLLHHNDLHSSNILLSCRSPLPDLCILDFGESSCGPRKTIA